MTLILIEWQSISHSILSEMAKADSPDSCYPFKNMDPVPLKQNLPDPLVLQQMGEPFAAGFFEEPTASPFLRWSRGVRRRWESKPCPPWEGSPLYPNGLTIKGEQARILTPSYSYTWSYREDLLKEKFNGTPSEETRQTLLALEEHMRSLEKDLDQIHTVHTVGGRGYTHSVPHYGRVLKEGLLGYDERIREGLSRSRNENDATAKDIYEGLLDVLTGVKAWHARLLQALRASPLPDPDARVARDRLLSALRQVPFCPARDFFEAVAGYNVVYYLDDCDNPGRVDQELWTYFEKDLQQGKTTYAEAVDLIRVLWKNCDANSGWSAGIGGSSPSLDPAYNQLTRACLDAAHGLRRPNLQLHVRKDMPETIWDAALDTLATGCGLPALYCEESFLEALQQTDLGIREKDLGAYNGGGCTETMIHGRSNVGSLDAGIHLPLILEKTLQHVLPTADSFESVLMAFFEDVDKTILEICDQVRADQQAKSRLRPQPMRTLLMDDCVETGRDFNAGGARYNWSVVNVAGLANAVDALAALRELVFERKEKNAGEILRILEKDFQGEEPFRQRLSQCPRYGNDDRKADDLAVRVGKHVFESFLRERPWRGGRFLPSCLMFVTYTGAGASMGASLDGRKAGEPIADSAGPHQGRDINGPTAMLRSVSRIPHRLAPGTLVVNLRLSSHLFLSQEGRRKVRDLIETYFQLGGMQIQINVVDQSTLREAMKHPERHQDLVVRVGGYSEYFNRLSPDLQRTVLERTEHQ